MSTSCVLPMELVNKILYEHKGLSHPVALMLNEQETFKPARDNHHKRLFDRIFHFALFDDKDNNVNVFSREEREDLRSFGETVSRKISFLFGYVLNDPYHYLKYNDYFKYKMVNGTNKFPFITDMDTMKAFFQHSSANSATSARVDRIITANLYVICAYLIDCFCKPSNHDLIKQAKMIESWNLFDSHNLYSLACYMKAQLSISLDLFEDDDE